MHDEPLNNENVPRPRYCTMIKKDMSEEYGYYLHAEKGKPHFIGCVDNGGLAHLAGIRSGDRIFAVNGHNIVGENHKQVVRRIKENPLKCELLVLSEQESSWYQKQNIPITLSLPNIIYSSSEIEKQDDCFGGESVSASEEIKRNSAELSIPDSTHSPEEPGQYPENLSVSSVLETDDMARNADLRPRLCHLKKRNPSDEFGFNLHAEKNLGHFIGTVDKDGIGELAGLEMGQRIVGVNGQLVYPGTAHKDVVAFIKMDPIQTDLLVASEHIDRWYTENRLEYSFDNAELYLHNHSSSIGLIDDNTVNEKFNEDSGCSAEEKIGSETVMLSAPEPEIEGVSILKLGTELPRIDLNEIIVNDASPKSYASESQFVGEFGDENSPTCEKSSIRKTTNSFLLPVYDYDSNGLNRRTDGSSENGTDNIFALSADEARNRLAHQKKDPRRDSRMSLEEKYRLVSNM